MCIRDSANLPYGSKTPEQIIHLTDTAIQPLLLGSCDVIIIACNTATTVALPTLRERYPTQRFIGIEPMIKTAATLTKHHSIAAVSYTHLDVYKRQLLVNPNIPAIIFVGKR